MRTFARRTVALASSAAAVAVLSVPAAVASPPVPLISRLSDLARSQVVAGGPATAPPGSDTFSASYTLAPGGGTGWRTARGTSVLAVTEGVLTLREAKGCKSRQFEAGQAAVVPAGSYLVANGGSEPLEFAGVFLGLRAGGDRPLVDGAAVPAPAGCSGSARVSGVVATAPARGTMVRLSEYGVSVPAKGTANRIVVEETKDVLVAAYELQPEFSTGWVTHLPAFAVVSSGTLTYFEGQAGQCIVAAEYSAGQAYSHPGGLHLASNEGSDPVEITVVYFNLPHGGAGAVVPVLGNTLDAVDFTPLPPRDCPSIS